MKHDLVQHIKNDPNYALLVDKRSRFGWQLSFTMLFIYFGFILLIAFDPALLGMPLATGWITTIGVPLGLGVIMSAFVLTGIYVWRANGEFDVLIQKIKDNAKEEA
ncbi:MAG: hypothetical protein QG558_1029 [Campylobacterota bacterium]|nr:hypothetical protein [Campylobacterota bacterium]